MKTFNHEFLKLVDVCEHNGLDYQEVLDQISESDVCFGTNADTLIHGYWLNALLGRDKDLDFGEHDDDILISLGC